MRVKATSMIKFGYCMLALNMGSAGLCFLSKDEEMHDRTLLFMLGSCVWIVMLLVWYKVAAQQAQDENQHQ
jgi:hypothetical protein